MPSVSYGSRGKSRLEMIHQIFGPDKEDPIDFDHKTNTEDFSLVTLSFSEPALRGQNENKRLRPRPRSSLIVPSKNSILPPNTSQASANEKFRIQSAPDLKFLKEDLFHITREKTKCFAMVSFANKDYHNEITSGSDDVFEDDHVSVEDNIQIWDNQENINFEKTERFLSVNVNPSQEERESKPKHLSDIKDSEPHFAENVPGAIASTSTSEVDSSRAQSRSTFIDNSSKKRKSWWTVMFFCLSRN